MPLGADDPASQVRIATFVRGLQELGWTIGSNMQIETRWSAGIDTDTRKYAAELVALAPDLILANGTAGAGPLAPALSTAWRGPAVMPRVSWCTSMASA